MIQSVGANIHEKCAVVGIEADPDAANLVIDGLKSLQHRGSASTGTSGFGESGELKLFREPGMASNVYSPDVSAQIAAWGLSTVIGQDRYATSGPWDRHLQPVSAGRVLFAHNGNSSMPHLLDKELTNLNVSHGGTNDSEMSALLINRYLELGADIPDAIHGLMNKFEGALSCVALIKDRDGSSVLAAFRDRYGVRPLVFGKTKNGGYAFASETSGLDAIDATYEDDVNPGEILLVQNGELTSYQVDEAKRQECIFEYIYFSDPDSLLHGVRVGDIRREFGRQLGAEYRERQTVDKGSIVVGIPRSALEAAEGFAEELGLEYVPAITKNENTGRSFMEPNQKKREEMRNLKYKYLEHEFAERHVILIDDSIVRNNTARHVVGRVREFKARRVEVEIASPPMRFANYFGLDTSTQEELPASHRTVEELRADIGAENLGFLSLRGLMKVVKKMTGLDSNNFELSSFNGEYVIPIGNRRIYKPVSDKYAEWAA